MITPKNRKDFENHINMLFEGLQQGTHNIPNHKRIINSLVDVKYSPNRRIDFLTINESVRLMANSRATFSSQQFKKRFNAEQ